MAASVKTSGSQTATAGGAEDVLATVTDAGAYVLVVDTAAMVDGDIVELRIYGKSRSGDTERVIYRAAFAHSQGEPLKQSVCVISPHHAKFSLVQSAGTARAFPWAVYAA